jgi:site-specific DNA recombinase
MSSSAVASGDELAGSVALGAVASPVAVFLRTSTKDPQDPTLSLPRQLDNCRRVLPAGFEIVAFFYDVESSRIDLDRRGLGHAHEAFDIPIPRDGGLADLLAEATHPGRRFEAVLVEEIERAGRMTYQSTQLEHTLEPAGVPLFAADEGPISLCEKRATQILVRRMKQGVGEWYLRHTLEQSWGGFREHTRQGWNIGKAPYGYTADLIPHPVAAKREEGKTKSRLVVDPLRGPVITQIYAWRADEQLAYKTIAERPSTPGTWCGTGAPLRRAVPSTRRRSSSGSARSDWSCSDAGTSRTVDVVGKVIHEDVDVSVALDRRVGKAGREHSPPIPRRPDGKWHDRERERPTER